MKDDNHYCKTEKCWGKAYHVTVMGDSNRWFCCYCGEELSYNQLAFRWRAEIDRTKNRINNARIQ